MDLATFASLMFQRANNLPGNVHSVKQAVATEILTNLCEAMPVDTGRAVSNTKVNQPDSGVDPPFAPGFKGSTRSDNVRATINAGMSVIGSTVPGQDIGITNSVPYVEDLNSGTSRQAPAGFVETSVLVGRSIIPGFKVL